MKNPLLEKAINQDNFTFGKMRELVTITNLLGNEKKQIMNKELSASSVNTNMSGTTILHERDQPTTVKPLVKSP